MPDKTDGDALKRLSDLFDPDHAEPPLGLLLYAYEKGRHPRSEPAPDLGGAKGIRTPDLLRAMYLIGVRGGLAESNGEPPASANVCGAR